MTRRQQKALRRSKAIKKKQNIDRIKNRAKSAAVVAGVTAVLSTPNISAQNAIDEIVVTARKKPEVILDIPMNISSISEEEMKIRNIIDKESLYRTIAGAASPRGQLILRGLSGSNSSTPGTTNVWTDGVPFNFSNVYDVQRVEIFQLHLTIMRHF